MKRKISNYIFIVYLGIIVIFTASLLIWLGTIINKVKISNPAEHYSSSNLKSMPYFRYVKMGGAKDIVFAQGDSCATNSENYIVSNDTLYLLGRNTVFIFKDLDFIEADSSEFGVVFMTKHSFRAVLNDCPQVNFTCNTIDDFNLEAKNTNIALIAKKIKHLNVDLKDTSQLSIVGKIKYLSGNNAQYSQISALPKPNKFKLTGNGQLSF